jgi:hypothetical protein
MGDSNENTRHLASRHAELLKAETYEIARATVTAITRGSPIFDKVTTWLLGAAGAAAALIIPHVSEAEATLGRLGLRLCLTFLFVSMVAGAFAKRLGVLIQFHTTVADYFPGALDEVSQHFAASYANLAEASPQEAWGSQHRADASAIVHSVIDGVPWILRWAFRRGMRKGTQDPLGSYRTAFRQFAWQLFWSAIEVIAFIAFLGTAALFV